MEIKIIPKNQNYFHLKANMLDISDHSVGQGIRVVSVGDPLKQQCCYGRAFPVGKPEMPTKG